MIHDEKACRYGSGWLESTGWFRNNVELEHKLRHGLNTAPFCPMPLSVLGVRKARFAGMRPRHKKLLVSKPKGSHYLICSHGRILRSRTQRRISDMRIFCPDEMLALGTSAQQIPACNGAEMTESFLEHRLAAKLQRK